MERHSGPLQIRPEIYKALEDALKTDVSFLENFRMEHVMTIGIIIVAEHEKLSFNEKVEINEDNKVIL